MLEQGVINASKRRNEFRFIDFHKVKNFVLEYLKNNPQYENIQLSLLRNYLYTDKTVDYNTERKVLSVRENRTKCIIIIGFLYTGEYTNSLIEKIEKQSEKDKYNKKLKELLDHSKKKYAIQKNFIKFSKSYYFFELRLKPLQFSSIDYAVFQKGVDVQLASDLVDFTHKNIYDISVLLSGDVDLLESIKIVKGMGKHIIIFSDANITAEEMKRHADLFIDMGRFSEEQLNRFTHIPDEVKR